MDLGKGTNGASTNLLPEVVATVPGVGVALAAGAGQDSELSISTVMTSLALTLGPTLLFLSRTPAVVEMADDLIQGNDDAEVPRAQNTTSENANTNEWADEPEELPTILARF